MMVTRTELINEMERERRRRKLNHQDFSTLLKISKSYWCMIRKGTRRPTLYVLQTILHQVPQLGVYVDSYMRQENDGDKEKRGQEIINPGNSEKPPSKTGVEKPSDYLGHGKAPNNARKPSNNAT